MSNTSSSSSSSGGIGITGLLTVLFVALKLTHVIDWSWWWVVSPLWIGAGIVLAIFAVGVAGILAVAAVKAAKK